MTDFTFSPPPQRHAPYTCGAGVNASHRVNASQCHDRVDLTLCFEDTAVLGGICALLWLLAGAFFVCGNSFKPPLRWSPLHAANLVRGEGGGEGGGQLMVYTC